MSVTLSHEAALWLGSGERGLSSECLFYRTHGIASDRCDSPLDPDDLRRCLLLCERVPECAAFVPSMASVSAEWAALVAQWDSLATLLDEELPGWRSPRWRGRAPRTLAAMMALRKVGR